MHITYDIFINTYHVHILCLCQRTKFRDSKKGKTNTYLLFPGPVGVFVVLFLLFLFLLLVGCLVGNLKVGLAEKTHGKLQQRVLAVVGYLKKKQGN